MPKPRIAFYLYGHEAYGHRSAVENLCRAMRAEGWQVFAALRKEGNAANWFAAAGAKIEILSPAPPSLRHIPLRLRTLQQLLIPDMTQVPDLLRMLRRNRVTALHTIQPGLLPQAGSAAREAGIPCLWEMSNVITPMPWGINRRIYQHLLKRYGITPLAHSAMTAQSLLPGPVIPEPWVLGSDSRRFSPKAKRRHGGKIRVGMVARLVEEKGAVELLTACMRLDADRMELVLVGGPGTGKVEKAESALFRTRLSEQARRGGWERRLHLAGEQSSPESWIRDFDFSVSCRRTPESFGLNVVEAMLMGKPVLAYARGGPGEIIRDGIDGWLVDNEGSHGLEAGLRRALADRPRWAAMGRAALLRARLRYSFEAQLSYYKAALRRASAGMKAAWPT